MQRAFAVATLQDNLRRVADVALRLAGSALRIIPLWDGSDDNYIKPPQFPPKPQPPKGSLPIYYRKRLFDRGIEEHFAACFLDRSGGFGLPVAEIVRHELDFAGVERRIEKTFERARSGNGLFRIGFQERHATRSAPAA